LVLAILVVTGCTASNNPITRALCQPSYTKLGTTGVGGFGIDCRSACQDKYGVSSYKTERETIPVIGGTTEVCYCDLNNCNP
jgi:hypothetical protein